MKSKASAFKKFNTIFRQFLVQGTTEESALRAEIKQNYMENYTGNYMDNYMEKI